MDTKVEQPNNSPGYCVACGNPLRLNSRFCSSCGQAVQVGVDRSAWRSFRRMHILLQIVVWLLGWWFMVHFYIWGGTRWRWYWKAAASAPLVLITIAIAAI